MSLHTGIEWCDSTANPAMGCDGCELWNESTGEKRCYAGVLTERYGGHSKGYPAKFTEPQIFSERIAKMSKWSDLTGTDRRDKPWLNGYPRTIFLGDMGDNFTESLPLMWLEPHIPVMAAAPHIQILLTKRPARMFQFWAAWCHSNHCPIPPNFWLLTSVTGPGNVRRLDEVLKLRDLGAAVLGVSYEPAWDAVNFRPYLRSAPFLDWVIAGGESGGPQSKRSHPLWFRDARDDCQESGRAFFFKQWGEYWPLSRTDGVQELPFGAYDTVSGFGFIRRGKQKSGAVLDGREWRQMPPVANTNRTSPESGVSDSLNLTGAGRTNV